MCWIMRDPWRPLMLQISYLDKLPAMEQDVSVLRQDVSVLRQDVSVLKFKTRFLPPYS